MNFIDAHCHLADPRIYAQAQQLIEHAQQFDIQTFLQAGVDPEDWQRQLVLQKKFPGVLPCFGLHPYFVADHSNEDCEQALTALSKMIGKAYALGETGLDFRPHIMKDSRDRQLDYFEKQLELAQMAAKPVVLHIVRAFEESIQVLQLFGLPRSGGFVHSFNGSAAQASAYLDLGLLLSVGGPVCRPDNQRLQQALQGVPIDKLLLETDSPDQPPPGVQSNQPSTLWKVAESVGKIKQLPAAEVLDKCSQNLRKLLSL